MNNSIRKILCIGAFIFGSTENALVEPQETSEIIPGWMASVRVDDFFNGGSIEFCKGSLIDPYWVLTASACFFDPYDTISSAAGEFPPSYGIELGNAGNHYDAEKLIRGPEITLIRLARRATETPIPYAARSSADLVGAEIQIFNNKITPAIGHFYYNVSSDNTATCSVDGTLFVLDNVFCSILPTVKTTANLQVVKATAIAPDVENLSSDPINRFFIGNIEDNYLYFDRGSGGGYLCHEDMGAAVLGEVDGELKQVGIVLSVGYALALPMCHASLVNVTASLQRFQDEIETVLLEGKFDLNCPASTHLHWRVIEGSTVNIDWHGVEGASGYRIFFTPNRGYEPIQTVELSGITELTTELLPDVTYSLAIQAFNNNCAGALSDVRTIKLATTSLK